MNLGCSFLCFGHLSTIIYDAQHAEVFLNEFLVPSINCCIYKKKC